LSLGQGQSEIARNKIRKAAEEGDTWVVLQNCHLAPSFMPILDNLLEEIKEDKDSKFRIWLTSMPSDKFPVSILQNGVKATSEPPKGIKNNVLKSYMSYDDADFQKAANPTAYRRLLWGLSFFNALVLERRKYGPLGWNTPYQFSDSDLSISRAQLFNFLEFYSEIPWEALNYMVAEANYGGRVTDPQDRRCIKVMLSDYYCVEMVKYQNHKLSESGVYYVPSDGEGKADYIEFIKNELPLNDIPEIFGMHDNAEITSAINNTNAMLSTALSLQPRKTGGDGKSADSVLQELA